MPGVPISESRAILCLFCIFLVPLAISGIALVNAGLGRSHSAAHALLTSMCLFAVATGVYFVCGFAWQGFLGGPSRTLLLSGKQWNWLGDEPSIEIHLTKLDSRSSLLFQKSDQIPSLLRLWNPDAHIVIRHHQVRVAEPFLQRRIVPGKA